MSNTLERQLPHRPARSFRTGPLALGVVAAALASLVVNTAIALAATSAHPSGPQTGLSAVHYAPLTVLGVLAGTAGWAFIRRNSRRPREVLRVVVPLIVLVSFVPDMLLLVLLPTTTLVNVAALLSMHIAIAAITVPMLGRVLPLPVPLPPRRG